MATALIGIGSNLGDGRENVRRALALLSETPDIEVARSSRLYASEPVGGPPGQGIYFNAAAVLQTSFTPHTLLRAMQETEAQLGRTRDSRWAARTIDLDLLLFDDEIIDDDDLTLPHPRMSFRRFVLEPALEIAPEMVHPVTSSRIDELLARIDHGPHYVAIGGSSYEDRSWLAKQLASVLGCPLIRWDDCVVHWVTDKSTCDPRLSIIERCDIDFANELKRDLWIAIPQRRPAFLNERATATSHPLLSFLESCYKSFAKNLSHDDWNARRELQTLWDAPVQISEDGFQTAPAVSNYWFEEWRFHASRIRLQVSTDPPAPQEYHQLIQELSGLSRTIPSPKLVIWLNNSQNGSADPEEYWATCAGCRVDERQVTGVQGAHRGDQANAFVLPPRG